MTNNLSVEVDPEKVKTTYEWVVEQMDGDDIVECFYWDDKSGAIQCASNIRAAGGDFDFGLCYSRGSDCDGEIDRQYAYCPRNTTSNLPEVFEGGRAVPKRFAA